MQRIAKFLVALVFAVLMTLASALTDDNITTNEWLQVAIAGASAIGVWIAANTPVLTWAKTAIAAVMAGLNAATAVVTDGISKQEWVNVGVAALGVVFVYFFPNKDATPARE